MIDRVRKTKSNRGPSNAMATLITNVWIKETLRKKKLVFSEVLANNFGGTYISRGMWTYIGKKYH
jgi:hypothetical protein